MRSARAWCVNLLNSKVTAGWLHFGYERSVLTTFSRNSSTEYTFYFVHALPPRARVIVRQTCALQPNDRHRQLLSARRRVLAWARIIGNSSCRHFMKINVRQKYVSIMTPRYRLALHVTTVRNDKREYCVVWFEASAHLENIDENYSSLSVILLARLHI